MIRTVLTTLALLAAAPAWAASAPTRAPDGHGGWYFDEADAAQEVQTGRVVSTEPGAGVLELVTAKGRHRVEESLVVDDPDVLGQLTPGEAVIVYSEGGRHLAVAAG